MTECSPLPPCRALLVEAFTEEPCGGNGAAVVLLEQPLPDRVMQAVARSLNQSETAFLLRHPAGWLLRWFTPTCEVPLCGHATLAATLALGHWGELGAGETASLHSRSGPLPVQLLPQTGVAAITLPSHSLSPAQASPGLMTYLQQQLGTQPKGYWESELGYRVVLLPQAAPLQGAILPADSLPQEVRCGLVLMQSLPAAAAAPAGAPIAPPARVLGEPCHYQLRFLAPDLGIPEDPVTGSAHALVAPWWMGQLALPRVRGWQCSDRPGGVVCEAGSSGMIRLSGAGHLLWDGTLQLGSPAVGEPFAAGQPGAGCGGRCGWDSLLDSASPQVGPRAN
jgi:predicted PhzF superfamily epimerase YddE/YHI9